MTDLENKEHKKEYRKINKEKIKEYQKEYNKEYLLKNKEKVIEYMKIYRLNNKEHIKENNKEYYQNNAEKLSKKQKEYNQKNKQQLNEKAKEYYQNNKEKLSKKQKEYNQKNKIERNKNLTNRRETDSLFKLRTNIRNLIYISIKKQGYLKQSRTFEILGCEYEDFKLHLERQFTKGMTWENQGEWHLDHIYPVSLAKDEEELIKLNHYTNFQPMWAAENISKGNRIIANTQIKLI